MKFADLLHYLHQHTDYDILDGGPAETLEKSRAGTHRNPIVGEIIRTAAEGLGIESVDAEIERVAFVNALGRLRLKYMADDAPVDGFRTVETVIATTDAAFDEEALTLKGK